MPSSRSRLMARSMLAGPATILVTILLLAGMPLWLPAGAAGVDNLAIPLILAPVIWALLFLHACLDRRLARVVLILALLGGIHGALVAWHLGHAPRTGATPS